MNEDELLYYKGYIDADGKLTLLGARKFVQWLFDSDPENRKDWANYLRLLNDPNLTEDKDGEC